jgi:hypothetical protein
MSTSTSPSGSAFGAFLASQLELPYRMVTMLAADFTDEESKQRAGDSKPLVWYIAHVTITKNYALKLFDPGYESVVSEEFLKRFGRGSDGSADFGDAPSKDELLAQLAKIHDRARDFVSRLSLEDMEREANGDVSHPLFAKLGSAFTLVASHDAYHAGQIANLRRAMGKDPLFG